MKYKNPVVKGFYPDPSVCEANGKYYLVCSSFQYFPGVPLFESDDLVNWRQIGHVLTRKSQVMLEGVYSSGGVFAPTIRYNNGRFYMITNNNTTQRNFYVWTDDIHGEWSEPIEVEQDGIDPSLYFENGHAYFISNGTDDNGEGGVVQCEIDIATGSKLSPTRCLWNGSGGRFLESPHMYKIDGTYYLMAAEGGTEYGHMITISRSDSVWGPFENCPHNPVLTNRNKAPYMIQGIGHGDLIQDRLGNWYILCLGFRQIDTWLPYHHLGREVFLTPCRFAEDGWLYSGKDGTTDLEYEIPGEFIQNEKKLYSFNNTDWNIDWCFMRHPDMSNYELASDKVILHGTKVTLDEVASPTFVALRQRDLYGRLTCTVQLDSGEAGITAYMSENEHYEIALRKGENGHEVIVRLNIGEIKHIQSVYSPVDGNSARFVIRFDNLRYYFAIDCGGKEIELTSAQTRYLSTEVSGGFTGVLFGLYAVGDSNRAEFTDFICEYE